VDVDRSVLVNHLDEALAPRPLAFNPQVASCGPALADGVLLWTDCEAEPGEMFDLETGEHTLLLSNLDGPQGLLLVEGDLLISNESTSEILRLDKLGEPATVTAGRLDDSE
jgi:hypothetical protein